MFGDTIISLLIVNEWMEIPVDVHMNNNFSSVSQYFLSLNNLLLSISTYFIL